jgi:hypothetical protein
MRKHSVFAGGIMLLVAAIAFQSMRADAVPGVEKALTQSISPMQMMQNAGDLPVERVDSPV